MAWNERTCLVTGASRGIGKGIAEDFGEQGANVAVNYRSSATEAEAVCQTIRDSGGDAIPVQANVADEGAVQELRETVTSAFGTIDVLVNNAAVNLDRRFENMSREDWEHVLNVNLGGVFNCTRVCYDDIRRSENGRLINISSIAGTRGIRGQANYATSKAGLLGFTRTLALELARDGATANCVAPGFVLTDMMADVSDSVKEYILERIPLARFAEVEDIVGIVRYLAGEESAYTTGEVISVNGGYGLTG